MTFEEIKIGQLFWVRSAWAGSYHAVPATVASAHRDDYGLETIGVTFPPESDQPPGTTFYSLFELHESEADCLARSRGALQGLRDNAQAELDAFEAKYGSKIKNAA